MHSHQRRSINDLLKIVAPGTQLREGIDNVLRAKTGGLIVFGYDEKVQKIVEGGFSIQCPFSPAYLYELAKMDGAIILSDDGKTILFANTQLVPDSTIPSSETGIRHRTAERTAKQTGKIVISISQRRSVVTLYKGNLHYALKDIGVILTKANQAMQTLEKYRTALDKGLTNLGALEFEELVTFQEITQIIHRMAMVLRIRNEITNYIHELGTEGRLISMQMMELAGNVESEACDLIKDYAYPQEVDEEQVLKTISELGNEELLNEATIVKVFGHSPREDGSEEIVFSRGYRMLRKIPRLPSNIINNLVEHFGHLNNIVRASIEELDEVEGIGDKRANKIKSGLERIQEQLFIERMV